MNGIIETLLSHRSIRRFRDEPVPDEHLLEAVRAGQAASTSSAVQAYCAIRVTDLQMRRELVALTGNQEKVARCGAFLAICGDTRRHRLAGQLHGRSHASSLEAFVVAVVDASLFAQNLCVALESMGYGICYVGGLRNHLRDVDRLLAIPEGVYPFFGLCVGVPDEEPIARPRLAPRAVLFENRYPDDATMIALMQEYDGPYREYLAARGAAAKPWTESMAEKFTRPERTDVGPYYREKGAVLE